MQRILWAAYSRPIKQYAFGRIADIGCGDVPYWELYRHQTNEQICIDWKNTSFGSSHLDYEVDLNFPIKEISDQSFDTVLCTDVLEHVFNPHVLFSELSRILKRNGFLIVGVPFFYWVHAEHDYFRFTERMLEKYCDVNNLQIVSLETYGGLPEIIFDLIDKGYGYYNFPFKSCFKKAWGKFGRFIAHFEFISRMSIRSRSTFPLGYVLVARK